MRILDDIRTIRALLTTAESEAHAMGDEAPGAEHLVLASLQLKEDSARVLLGVGPDRFRQAIVATHAAALASIGVDPMPEALAAAASRSGAFRSEGSAQEVFQRARVIAKADRSGGLTGAHIVRAAAERGRGTVARVLSVLSIDRETLR